ncbi:MAG: glycine cleavage system H-protein subunit [Phylliscum demangeonii]|nr:MAG: glycine cleavage system H-protein subunit [Phylliscum demangeonii]
MTSMACLALATRRSASRLLQSGSSRYATTTSHAPCHRPSRRSGSTFTAQWRTAATTTTQGKRAFSLSAAVHEKRYTVDHEWVELSADGQTATIGISTYAASQLGDVVYVELPTLDTTAQAGDVIGAVESVKSAEDLMSPMSGTVVDTNQQLEQTPALINRSPEADGWIAKVQLGRREGTADDEARELAMTEMQALMDGEAYQRFVGEEEEKEHDGEGKH